MYLRQSMDRTGQELAIDRQREDVMRYVTAMGWDVLGEFVDNDVSASSAKRRPDFERMMSATSCPFSFAATLIPVLQPFDRREDRQRRGVDEHGYCGAAQADSQTGAVDWVEPAAAP